MTTKPPKPITILELIDSYDALFFDAFGVLVDANGALPFAPELIRHLNHLQKPYFVVSNGSRFTRYDTALRYRNRGLEIADELVITSGSLIEDWIKAKGLQGSRALALGPASAQGLVSSSGCEVISLKDPKNFDVFVVADQFDVTMDDLNLALSYLIQQFEKGRAPLMLLPNPDLIYPASPGFVGITSGSIALIIEQALSARFNSHDARFQFVRLGKPFAPIFDAAKARLGDANMRPVMIGDQLSTDIQGARNNQLDSALIGTGIIQFTDLDWTRESVVPTYLLKDLQF